MLLAQDGFSQGSLGVPGENKSGYLPLLLSCRQRSGHRDGDPLYPCFARVPEKPMDWEAGILGPNFTST